MQDISGELPPIGSVPVTDANSLILKISGIFDLVIWLLISLAVLYIIWNVVQFIKQSDSSERDQYRNSIMWGIVGLAVILSIWGLVAILTNTFASDNVANQVETESNVNSLMLRRPNP